ncbi:MAG: SIR2 family protein [Desulfomonilaceae bacterium]
MKEIPLPLRHSIEAGNCVLFLGAGIGLHLLDSKGNPAPTGSDLAKELAEGFSIEADGVDDLAMIAEVVCIRKGRSDLEAYLRKRFSGLEPDEHLQWLLSMRWRAIYSTNYDYGIERACELMPSPIQKPITMSVTADFVDYDPRFEVPVFHLHGILFGPSKPQIVITQADYLRFRERRKMLFERLKLDFLAHPTSAYVVRCMA